MPEGHAIASGRVAGGVRTSGVIVGRLRWISPQTAPARDSGTTRSEPLAEIHGDQAPFLGVRELWWSTVGAFREGVAKAPEAFAQLVTRVSASVTVLVQSGRFK